MEQTNLVKFAEMISDINSTSDLRQISKMLSAQHDVLCRRAQMIFKVGDPVRFTRRNGTIIEGTITKICPKNIKVHSGFTDWTVSPTLLEPAD